MKESMGYGGCAFAEQSRAPHGAGTFTPGPWQNGLDDLEGVVSVGPLAAVGDGNVVCLPPDFRMEASYARWQANARLIAAAPDMLEALYQYESDLLHPPTGDSRERRLERVRKVIAKARGPAEQIETARALSPRAQALRDAIHTLATDEQALNAPVETVEEQLARARRDDALTDIPNPQIVERGAAPSLYDALLPIVRRLREGKHISNTSPLLRIASEALIAAREQTKGTAE